MTTKETFISCIHSKQKWILTFYSNKEKKVVMRTIAPLDFWPQRKPKAQSCFEYIDNWTDKFHYYDFDWSNWWHSTSKNIDEVQKFEPINEQFDPKWIINWTMKCPWHIDRNW